MGETITVRKVSFGQGVERIFPVQAPVVDHIDVVRTGRVRRAKLYYLRELKGKAARLRERDIVSAQDSAMPSSRYERAARSAGYRTIAGVDEAGRGALFGPGLRRRRGAGSRRGRSAAWTTAKQLDPDRREVLAGRIRERAAAWAVAAADAFEIDRVNILEASRLAMKRAVERAAARTIY